MKTIIILILVTIVTSINFSQTFYYKFRELRGLEDGANTSHLFYRQSDSYEQGPFYFSENSIFHRNTGNESDSIFLYDGIGAFGGGYVKGLKFYNNNISDYIYVRLGCGIDCNGELINSDGEVLHVMFQPGLISLGISQQDKNFIYISHNILEKTVDKGVTWDTLQGRLLADVSPYNDSIQFFKYENNLYKSSDRGITFSQVDSGLIVSGIYWDKNPEYIYYYGGRYNNQKWEYKLLRSSAAGNAFSWQIVYESNTNFSIQTDEANSGTIYIGNKEGIKKSTNYGSSFSDYYSSGDEIKGFYVKPGGGKLYYITNYKLFEWSGDSLRVLKQLQVNPAFAKYYPLAVGNKWVYRTNYFEPPTGYSVEDALTITEKSVMPNGKEYFVFLSSKNGNKKYERYDSLEGRVYRYNIQTGTEAAVMDFAALEGERFKFGYFGNGEYGTYFRDEIMDTVFGLTRRIRIYEESFDISSSNHFSFTENIGYSREYYIYFAGQRTTILKGAVINGIVYGDTTLVNVEERGGSVPGEFALNQNYPNPFNPVTVISFYLPVQGKVDLSVFDLLGRNVVTLINGELSSGEHRIEFNASKLAAGVYFYKIQSGSFSKIKKMTLLK
jgi:hypothetical protein